jgi:hypothetical protein
MLRWHRSIPGRASPRPCTAAPTTARRGIPSSTSPLSAAIAASYGPDGPLRPGRRADVVVLDGDLPDTAVGDAARAIRTMPVAGTLLAGRWTHRDGLEIG